MNKKFDQLSLPSDLYSRNYLIGESIRQYRKQFQFGGLRVLDVGGRGGMLSSFLDERDEFKILDILEGSDENLIVGDGTDMKMFKDDSFDVVVSGDVYEHIPQDKRRTFVSEAMRVSRDLVILAGPFDRLGVHDAEVMVNDFFKDFAGKDHQWLHEHMKYGLPDSVQFEQFVQSCGYSFQHLASNDLDNWVLLQLLVFYSYHYAVPESLVKRFYREYNQHLLHVEDFELGTYRSVYILTQKPFSVDLHYSLNTQERRFLRQKAFEIIGLHTQERSQVMQEQTKIMEDQHHVIEKSNLEVMRLEALLGKGKKIQSTLKSDLLQKAREMKDMTGHFQVQETLLKDRKKQACLKDNHIQNLDALLLSKSEQVFLKDQHIEDLQQSLRNHMKNIQQLDQNLSQQKTKEMLFKERILEKNDYIREMYAELQETRSQRERLRKISLKKQMAVRALKSVIEVQSSELDEKVSEIFDQQDLIARKNEDFRLQSLRIQDMTPDYTEFQQVKRSLSYRFLSFHRSFTSFFIRLAQDSLLGLKFLREQGWAAFWYRLKWYLKGKRSIADIQKDGALSLNEQYRLFRQTHFMSKEDRDSLKEHCEDFSFKPLISLIVPVYNVEVKWYSPELVYHDEENLNLRLYKLNPREEHTTVSD